MRFSERTQRIGAVAIATVLVFVELFLPVYEAKAVPVEVVADAPSTAFEIRDTILKSLQAAALSSLVSGASYFARKLAYDTAVAIATAGSGQKPLAITQSPGAYFKSLASDSVGSMIEQFGKPFGLNLCEVPDVRLNVYLQIGFRSLYPEFGSQGPSKPACNLGTFIKNWKTAPQKYGSTSALLDRFNADLNVKESDFGIALGAIQQIDNSVQSAKTAGTLDQLLGGGFKPVQSLISGNVKTPASVVKEESTAVGSKQQGDLSSEQISGIYAAEAAQILPMAGSVFLNTLAGQMLDRVLKRGLFADRPSSDSNAGGAGYGGFDGGTFTDNRRAAEQAFNFLFTSVPTRQLNSYDIVAEFATCPDTPGLNNCVIDTAFQDMLAKAKVRPITIAEAIKPGGGLNPDLPLISPRREFDNTDVKNCYTKGYCYSNIQKLRKVRILPLGFEIAALKSDPDAPWKLGDVVKNFETCGPRDAQGNVIPSAQFPHCHLIDPNWIIKAPETRCEARVYGPQRADSSSPLRQQECVDISTCIAEGPNGECLGSYGYCTKEKNIWRIGGDSCEAQFATCKTYVNEESGALASYLSRTLDYGQCTIDAVGCQAYSTVADSNGWLASVDNDNQPLYFNDTIDDANCPAGAEGCTVFATAKRNATSTLYEKNASGNFIRNRDVGTEVHLKKAPDYLGCYDADTTVAGTQWPTNETQLRNSIPNAQNNLPNAQACGSFAQACIADEIGCDGFTPINGGPEIPGVIGGNSCPTQCVGYDRFKQEATKFAAAEEPLYFVPSEGVSCSEQHVGCDEFTNIESTAQGGEQREYYTNLRYCEKPTQGNTNQKVFYTWEGSTEQGFVLRTHKLRPIDTELRGYIQGIEGISAAALAAYRVGSPAYYDFSKQGLEDRAATCTEATYNLRLSNPTAAGAASPDCRAFYDDAGNIDYRLLADIITVSADCRRLRKTESRLVEADYIQTPGACERQGGLWDTVGNSCQVCFNGGRYEAGTCVYQTIPSEATSCPATANGCRAYTGNAGNNVETVFIDEFEPEIAQWTGGRLSAEATQVGQHSLEVTGAAASRQLTENDRPQTGGWYQLSFWARGATQGRVAQTVKVTLNQNNAVVGDFTLDRTSNSQSYISIGQTWRQYTLGLVQYSGASANDATLVLTRQTGSDSYFIDNVRLTRVRDSVNLVKGSWKTPEGYDASLLCDTAPNDGLPGVMLGCAAYTNRTGVRQTATGFDRLCREQAIGCQPLYDTHNTTEGEYAERAQAFNVWCEGAEDQACVVTVGATRASCAVPRGEEGCYIPKVIIPPGATLPAQHIAASTVIVPADTADAAPIFLTVKREYQCQEYEKGCMKAGEETQVLPDSTTPTSYTHSDAYILNDPDKYIGVGQSRGTLCRSDLTGCSEFSAGATKSYFKDPQLTGKLCAYKPKVNGTGEYGWYLQGVGQCSNDPTGATLCRTSADCGTGNTCSNVGNVACYSDNQRAEEHGIWSNDTGNRYTGNVGICQQQDNLCTELIDVQNTSSSHPEGEPYYVIYNEKVTQAAGECEGNVSLKEGCVLFDKTDNPSKTYNAVTTYQNSARIQDGKVAPVLAPGGTGDSNVILKVIRDRACGEWLSCKSMIPRTNDQGGKDNLCYQYAACDEADGNSCGNWVSKNPTNSNPLDDRLSEAFYVRRNTRWNGIEYSGYSMFNKFQMSDLIYISLPNAEGASPTSYAVYRVPAQYFANPQYVNRGCSVAALVNGAPKKDWDICGFDDGGRCYQSQCVYPLEGKFSTAVPAGASGVTAARAELQGGSCKGYPEQDSPYLLNVAVPQNVIQQFPVTANQVTRKNFTQLKPSFNGANVCQNNGALNNCSCSYEKVSYRNGFVDFWPQENTALKTGVCTGGESERLGWMCDTDADCSAKLQSGAVSPSTCTPLDKKEQYIGLEGFCLERDFSRPISGEPGKFACLTWLPIDVSASGADIYNSAPEAAYRAGSAQDNVPFGQVYCLGNGTVGTGVSGGLDLDPADDELTQASPQSSGGGSGIGEANINCASGPLSAFMKSLCGVTVNDKLKKLLLWWGVQYGETPFSPFGLDKNIRLLRAEVGYRPDGNDYGFVPYQKNEDGVPTGAVTFHLASLPGNDEGARLMDGTNPSLPWYETGTQMHPPRLWSDNYSTPVETTYNVPAPYGTQSTIPLSPGPYLKDSRASYDNTSMVYRSPYELSLRDDIVNRVFFVPVGYPAGAEGVVPEILSSEIYINIDELVKKARAGTAPVTFNEVSVVDVGGSPGYYFPSNAEATQNGVVWSYMLQRGSDGSAADLLSHATYDGATGDLAQQMNNHAKNDVYSRYVMVFMSKSYATNNGIGPTTVPAAASHDFFDEGNAACNFNDDSYNWFAVGLDFNKEHEFLGYISRWCNGTTEDPEGDNGIHFAVFAGYKDQCVEFAKVYNTASHPLTGETNKAWTQRLWTEAPQTGWNRPRSNTVERLYLQYYFGSLALTNDGLANDALVRQYYFDGSLLNPGIPYGGSETAHAELFNLFAKVYDVALVVNPSAGSVLEAGGVDAVTRLSNPRGFDIPQTNPQARAGVPATVPNDQSYQLAIDAKLLPPQIYSINPATCLRADIDRGSSEQHCTVAEKDNVTINGRNQAPAVNANTMLPDYDKDGRPDEDANFNRVPDVIIQREYYQAVMNFFAFADDNKMPLRRIKVDWNDGTEVVNKDVKGLYKNRKPYCGNEYGVCQTSAGVSSGVSCDTDNNNADCPTNAPICSTASGVHFGNSDRACEEGYFEFIHEYTCDADTPGKTQVRNLSTEYGSSGTDAEARLLGMSGITQDSEVCVFKPAVQALDNWGWCNGVDAAGNPSVTGYFNDNSLTVCNNGGERVWTPYKGLIIVIPPEETEE